MVQDEPRYLIFETAMGFCAIAWNGDSVAGLRLPAQTAAAAERSMLRRIPRAQPAPVPHAVAKTVELAQFYFAGGQSDFSHVAIAPGPQAPFCRDVYEAVRRLKWGETTTYGAVARALGAGPEAARDVGEAMAKNPIPLIIPCHRVLAAGGKIGGFSAPGGSATKARMLALEGVRLGPPPSPAQQAFRF